MVDLTRTSARGCAKSTTRIYPHHRNLHPNLRAFLQRLLEQGSAGHHLVMALPGCCEAVCYQGAALDEPVIW
jgi:hypothetical protein